MPFQKVFSVSDGVVASETTPDNESLYCPPDELEALFSCSATEAQLRFVQGLINSFTNRPSLWPCEILEELNIPSGRQETQVSVTPLISISDIAGRYAFGRRDKIGYSAYAYGFNDILALTAAAAPAWSQIQPNTVEIVHAAGILYLPATWYFVPWNVIRVRYIAGYIQIPFRVKTAIAEILNTMASKGQSDRTRYSVGRISRQFASDNWITPAAAQMLTPFIVTSLF